jgi:hypothetical protein
MRVDVNMTGWTVKVESDAGPLFYAVAAEKPYDAEDFVRSELKIPTNLDVTAYKRLDGAALKNFGVPKGGLVGPF